MADVEGVYDETFLARESFNRNKKILRCPRPMTVQVSCIEKTGLGGKA